jgi:hypothetical protein
MQIFVSSPFPMPSGSKSFSLGVLMATLGVLAGPGSAQPSAGHLTWAVPVDGIRMRTEQAVDLHTTVEKPIDPYAYKRGLFAALGLYEYKAPGAVDGQYTRPHYALGLHSDLMRDALSLTGLDAESCVAPMVRLRARQATITGNTGISMSVSARCTFR